MKYLLDTDTLIDVLQGRGNTRERVNAFIEAGDEVALCPITVAEIYSGLSEKKRKEWTFWLLSLPYWHISRNAAMQAGIDRKTSSDAGRTLSATDSLIAACAREHDATVLTSNIKHYPMKDVRVLSLREKAA
jgi:predicted nucleic acid-binding protein